MEKRQFTNNDCWYNKICDDDCNKCVKYLKIKTLMNNSNVPSNLHHPINLTPACKSDIKAFNELATIKDDIVNFVNNGESLYICSHNTGNGKTSWALKLMYKLFSSQYDEVFIEEPLALFIYVTDFLLQLKDFNNPLSQKYLNYVKTVPLVIWDDIGTGTLSDYDYTQLLTYINARQQAQLSNIFTSNLITLDELSSKVGDKLASRIFNSSTIIELKGKDMR